MSHDDQTEARFRQIIDTEFGEPLQPPQRPQPDPEPFNLTQAMDQAEPDEPSEPFVPPRPPLRLPEGERLASLLLIGFAATVGIAGLLGAYVRTWGPWAVVAFVLGVVLLFRSLPRNPQERDDDGAQV